MRKILCLASLCLSGCLTMSSIPIDNLYVIDLPNWIAAHRIITNKESFASKKVEDLPLSIADGYICVSPEEFGKFRVWLKEQKK